jgi:hypothetical protein
VNAGADYILKLLRLSDPCHRHLHSQTKPFWRMPERTDVPFHITGEAEAILPARNNAGKPITVIGTEGDPRRLRPTCIEQALNSRSAPGRDRPRPESDAHSGYGAPVGCVMVSPTHIYPGPVGVDIKCSMSLLQMNIPAEIADKSTASPAHRGHRRAHPDRCRPRPARGEKIAPGLRRPRGAGLHRRGEPRRVRSARHPAGVGAALRGQRALRS